MSVITYRFATPCIISGADPSKAELRASSIRGGLRWWFRALGGSKEDERNVFGGIGKGDKGCASSCRIRVENLDCVFSSGNMKLLTGSENPDYFLWPLRKNSRGFIKDGGKFKAHFLSRSLSSKSSIPLKVLKAFSLFGGIGSRSSRCYGSLWPDAAELDGTSWSPPSTEGEFEKEAKNLLDGVECIVIAVSQKLQTSKDAIGICQKFLKTFRCGSDASGQNPSEWGKTDHDAPWEDGGGSVFRPVLGLPLVQQYRSSGERIETKLGDYERWASPLHLKIVPLKDGFLPIAMFWPTMCIPENAVLHLDRKSTAKASHALFWIMANPSHSDHKRYWRYSKVLNDAGYDLG